MLIRSLGLEIGADDYISKPVKPRVLLAPSSIFCYVVVCKTMRKNENNMQETNKLTFGALNIDNTRREAWLSDDEIELTSAEFDLLWLLSSNAGRILNREEIFGELRGIEYDGQDRSVDVRISRIRSKNW